MKRGILIDRIMLNPSTGEFIIGSEKIHSTFFEGEICKFSQDGQYYAVVDQTRYSEKLFEVATWNEIGLFLLNTVDVTSIAFSENNQYIAVASNNSPYVKVIDRSDPNRTNWTQVTLPAPINATKGIDITFSPNNQWLALIYNGGFCLTVWETTNWTQLTIPSLQEVPGDLYYNGRSFLPTRVTFSPNNAFLAISGNYPHVRVYNTATWTKIDTLGTMINPEFPVSDKGTGCVFSSDSQYMVCIKEKSSHVFSTSLWGADAYHQFWVTTTGIDLVIDVHRIYDVVFTIDGDYVWVASKYFLFDVDHNDINKYRVARYPLTPGYYPLFDATGNTDADIELFFDFPTYPYYGLVESPPIFFEISGTITSANNDFSILTFDRDDILNFTKHEIIGNSYSILYKTTAEKNVICIDNTDLTKPLLILSKITPG